ncbi:hypothetical protein [Streptomyces sp. NBC_01264]|uniref:hypothetical protein n=1 Tax=Streptomyces sp. NBC_01264 TaxID=2903804 RepID=UPI00224E9167|nr:hypothetical protein [Streptomyces sp. NBC_01264]MCX4782298.1 hypothetical protein [Streptomyces sp. NBC_01264]
MRRHHVIIALSAAGILALTGCGSDSGAPNADKPSASTVPSAAPSSSPSADPSAARPDSGLPPSPAPAQRAAYLAALNAIDPEIVNGKDDKAVSRGLDQCQSMKGEKDPAERVSGANQRFIGPNHPNGFGPVKSGLIVAAVQTNLCPTY